MVNYTVISTFAGCGGSSLGYKWAGFKELLAIEWDDNAIVTFKLNFPEVPIWQKDINLVSVDEILSFCKLEIGQLDILDGSPPCQGFSTAGKRQVTDPRNDLFLQYVRLIKGLQPKIFVMENVSGMIKGSMKGKFKEIMLTLKGTGYNVKCRLMNAMYYGVPQSRQRLIFIGVRKDLGIEPSYPKPLIQKLITFREAVKGLPENRQIPELDHVWVDEVAKKTKWINRASQLKPGEKLIPNQASGIRLYWDKPCPTIMKNAPPGCAPYVRNSMIHPSQSRTPSIREMARCCSFPDTFRFVDALTEGMHRIGNAVMPLFMKAIAEHIKVNILDFTGQKADLFNG